MAWKVSGVQVGVGELCRHPPAAGPLAPEFHQLLSDLNGISG